MLVSKAVAVPFPNPDVSWHSQSMSELFNSSNLQDKVAESRLTVRNGPVLRNCSGDD